MVSIKKEYFRGMSLSVLFLILSFLYHPCVADGKYSKNNYCYRASDILKLRKGFENPPIEAGPWVYWFCFDNAITAQEMRHQIREMAAAGIAGAELRFVEFAWWRKKEVVDKELAMVAHKRLEYLSDEFLDVLEQACCEAKLHGFKLAINMGMGWPPGGTWITDKYRSRKLESQVTVVEGPKQIGHDRKINIPKDAKVYAWKLKNKEEKTVAANSFVDLTGHVRYAGNQSSLAWNAPDGDWLIGVFWLGYGGKLDKAYGYAADPGSKEAIKFHLNYLIDKIEPKLGKYFGTTLTEVASDSWEYDGRPYWTSGMDEMFSNLHGYELLPRMYALAGYGDDREKIMAYVDRTQQKLVNDNFFIYAKDMLNSYGLGHRPQAYGRGLSRNLFEVYSNCDVPEIEEGIYCPEAVWVSHTLGKAITSVEGMTFISRQSDSLVYPFPNAGKKGYALDEHRKTWETNPAMLRWFSNAHYARGINRVQIHSFGYSPEGLPLPGWRMYAEIHLNRNVPWWPYMNSYSTWARRLQWILQSGRPVADTLAYPVKSNPADGPDNKLSAQQPISAINGIDAASEYTFNRIWENDGGQYQVKNLCLLSDIKTLDQAKKIDLMISKGVKVSFCGGEPRNWSAFKDQSNRTKNLLKNLQLAIKKGNMIDARKLGWPKVIEKNQSVKWFPKDALITYLHRQVEGAELYFLMNWGDEFIGEVEFGHIDLVPQLWDADTGKIEDCAQWKVADGKVRVKMRIGHLESSVVVFVKGDHPLHAVQCEGGIIVRDEGKLYAVLTTDNVCDVKLSDGAVKKIKANIIPAQIDLTEGWKLCISDKDGVGIQGQTSLNLDKLISWRQLGEVSSFSGTAKYEILFDAEPEVLTDDLLVELDLGKVYEVARVWLNNERVGVSWYPPYKIDITGFLKPGTNKLRVDVTNVLKNYLTEGEFFHPSGLLGPVTIRPYQKVLLGG